MPASVCLKVDWTSLGLLSCPQFQQLRRWTAERAVQAVGTLDRDRLQAQGLQRLLFLSECKERGVKVVTAQGVPMLDGGEGQLVELALALGKERSVLRAQQGARDGMRDRARLKGLPPTPKDFFGFKWDRERSRYITGERYADACEVWRMALAAMPIETIARELTRRGVLTGTGAQDWWPGSVRRILKNRAYAGVIEALKTEAVEPRRRRANTYGKTGRRLRPENERIRLQGLVEKPVVTEQEFMWMQQRLLQNQQFALKNTKLRSYLLRGLVRCAACDHAYVGVTIRRGGKTYSHYVCSARRKPRPNGDRCRSRSLLVDTTEEAVFRMVGEFLSGPEGFGAEVRRRQGVSEESVASLRRELADLDRQERVERDAEARAFRMAARGVVSEAVYEQEAGLIRTKQRWIKEQRERIAGQLADLERHSFNPESVAVLRKRLDARLAGATAEDRRFVLEAVGTKVIVQANGTWELELQVPRGAPGPAGSGVQIVNTLPGRGLRCGSGAGPRRAVPSSFRVPIRSGRGIWDGGLRPFDRLRPNGTGFLSCARDDGWAIAGWRGDSTKVSPTLGASVLESAS